MDSELTNTAPQPEELTTPTPAPATATSWWDGLAFEGKEYCELKPDGTLMLKATPFAPERVLDTVDADSGPSKIRALAEKFPKVETRVKELATEWEAAEDKHKLFGKVSILKDYLLHTPAIGNFAPLYQQVALWDNTLQEGADKAYAAKLEVVEKAEAIAAGEPTKEATQALKELTEQWKTSGAVDKERGDALWARLEAAKNGFFERKRERHDAEQAEMQNNLDLKTELVGKAEQLAASDSWKESTEAFKTLMDEWKATGRTFNDRNEALWQRFITAKNVFYDRKKQHFEAIQTEQEAHYIKKLELVAEAEAMANSTDWGKTSNAYNALMEQWKHIGRVPVEKADELWERLSKAKDTFFNAKRQHFATIRVSLDDNYAQKMALVNRAETLQHSNDWRGATDEFTELMEEWKKIGPVAREHSEALWEQYIKARRNFFARKDADRDRRRAQIDRAQASRVSQTQEFLNRLKEEMKEDEERLIDFQESLGRLTTGKKEDELRAHLEKLIAQTGPKVEKKKEKIAEVEAQLANLVKEANRKGKEGKGQKKPNGSGSTPGTKDEKEHIPTEPAVVGEAISTEPTEEITTPEAKASDEGMASNSENEPMPPAAASVVSTDRTGEQASEPPSEGDTSVSNSTDEAKGVAENAPGPQTQTSSTNGAVAEHTAAAANITPEGDASPAESESANPET